MPPQEQAFLVDKVVLWRRSGVDGFGQPTFDPPVEIDAKWEDKRTTVFNPMGMPISVDGTAVTDRYIPMESEVWKGTLADWNTAGSAQVFESEVCRIKSTSASPDLKGREATYTVGFLKHRSGAGG